MKKINVAIVGVGSLTKALVEGVSFYKKYPQEKSGLLHLDCGGYKVSDIHFVCAFDVDERKVGKYLHDAINCEVNVTKQITEAIEGDALVYRGPRLDGVCDEMSGSFVHVGETAEANVVEILKATCADIVINLLPTGSDQATYFYAESALQAGCSFINCIPTPLASLKEWKSRYAERSLVLLGDDLKSQFGATMLNRLLLETLSSRGVHVLQSKQENKGGNTDHYNLQYRSASKKRSKSSALSQYSSDLKPEVTFTYTGIPSGDKTVTLEICGEIFGRSPIQISAVIKDQISVNGAGTLVDAIRCAQYIKDNNLQTLTARTLPYLMKMTELEVKDSEAKEQFEEIIPCH